MTRMNSTVLIEVTAQMMSIVTKPQSIMGYVEL